ncbi:MAG: LamG-like jellyroll fold domain-containing protein, partial [Nocardioidaceae bacterium]
YVIARKGVASTPGGEFRLELTHAGRARCVVRDSTGLSRQVIGPVASLANGRWHKLKCRRLGSTLRVVVDGVARSKTVDFGSVSNKRALVIGSSYGRASGLHGRIDAVRLRIG